jgi:hypothetical protein
MEVRGGAGFGGGLRVNSDSDVQVRGGFRKCAQAAAHQGICSRRV